MITPTKPDEHGVRWCVQHHCQASEMNLGFCKCPHGAVCLPWLRAVMKATQAWVSVPGQDNDLQSCLEALQALDDLEPIYRELFP